MDMTPEFFAIVEDVTYVWFTNNSQSHVVRIGVLQPQTNERLFNIALHTCYCSDKNVKKKKLKVKKKWPELSVWAVCPL